VSSWGTDNAVLQWTAPGDNGTEGQASLYDVRYLAAAISNLSDFTNATVLPMGPPQPAGTAEALNVTGLTPDTSYWFALRTSDNKSNWSPLSNIAQVRTLTTLAGLPTVDSVSLNMTQGRLEVTFSEPMNRTSVEQSLTVSPNVPMQVKWTSDMKLQIVFAESLDSNTTYFLSIAPVASDEGGSPMAKTFTFRFGGLVSGPLSRPLGQPWDLALPILAGFVGLGVVTLTIFARSVRDQRKAERMQRAIAVLSNRFAALSISTRVRDLREWILSSRAARPPTVTLQKPRK
jgi:chitodextrinase